MPITFVKDNRLFGYSPRRELQNDFVPKMMST